MSVSSTPNELAAIVNDVAFAKRLKDFNEARKQAQEALTDLDLGRMARDAYADAKAKQEAAKKTLDDARKQAEDIISKARLEAKQMHAAAAGAIETAARIRDTSTKLQQDVNKRLGEVEQIKKLVEAEKKVHAEAAELARKAEAKFTDLVAKIRAVTAAV